MLSRFKSRFLLPVLLLLPSIFSVAISAQEAPKAQPSSPAPKSEQQINKGETSEQLAHTSKEAAGQESDPNEAFKHSAAVQWIARVTGLSVDTAYWISFVLNFLIVVVLLWIMLRKALPGILRNRAEAIQKRIEEARKTSEEARRRLTDVEGRLSRLDTEISQMRNEAEVAAQNEEQRLMAAAEDERRRIVQSAEQEIDRITSAARRDLKAYAAELAVDLAAKKIRIDTAADQMLVREFTARIGKDGQ